MADKNVKIVRKNGKPTTVSQPKTASEAFDKNSLVKLSSGKLTSSADGDTIVYGIIKEEVSSSDSDYADNTKKQVALIEPGDEIEIDTSAELTVGTSYGISGPATVDQSDTSNKVFTCTQVINSSRAIGYFNSYTGGNTV